MSWYIWDHEVCTGVMTYEDSKGTGQGCRVGCIGCRVGCIASSNALEILHCQAFLFAWVTITEELGYTTPKRFYA